MKKLLFTLSLITCSLNLLATHDSELNLPPKELEINKLYRKFGGTTEVLLDKNGNPFIRRSFTGCPDSRQLFFALKNAIEEKYNN